MHPYISDFPGRVFDLFPTFISATWNVAFEKLTSVMADACAANTAVQRSKE
jgi:hypothetical protein